MNFKEFSYQYIEEEEYNIRKAKPQSKAIYKCEICNTNPTLTDIFENVSHMKSYREQILSPKCLEEDFFSLKNGSYQN